MIEDAEKNIEPIAPANEQRNLELTSRIVASYQATVSFSARPAVLDAFSPLSNHIVARSLLGEFGKGRVSMPIG
ncbi:hypothetical protein LZK75_25815 (plasmid) [Rhizobium leguminosarum]|nr:hypothetical protein LZK75_25815 [Rhizobium leguminosarum]